VEAGQTFLPLRYLTTCRRPSPITQRSRRLFALTRRHTATRSLDQQARRISTASTMCGGSAVQRVPDDNSEAPIDVPQQRLLNPLKRRNARQARALATVRYARGIGTQGNCREATFAERTDPNNTQASVLDGTQFIDMTKERAGMVPIQRRSNVHAAAPPGEKYCHCIGDCDNGRCGCKKGARGHCTAHCHNSRPCAISDASATPSLSQDTTVPSTQPALYAQVQAQALTLAQVAAMQQQMQQQLV
jgi:hypothetical protein